MWNTQQAINLCIILESIAPDYGCHVALTGGLLYKPGQRKDADIMFYRIRQTASIDEKGLFAALTDIGIELTTRHGWVQKAVYEGRDIDFFFPEYNDLEACVSSGIYGHVAQ